MTKLLDEAITKVRALPDPVQDVVAEFLLGANDRPAGSLLNEAQWAEVRLSLQEAREGKFATDEEVAALWKKFGL
jgi:hypothetical protein